MGKLLAQLGAEVDGQARRHHATSTPRTINELEAPYELVKTMRASVLVLGPLVARYGRARVSLPGGCAIGARPIDQHLKGLEAMGAQDRARARLRRRARAPAGCAARPSSSTCSTVTGTENLMMAAALAKGRTTLENAAREPEVEELARVLNKMGARSSGAGTPLITIEGVDELQPIEHAIIPDRIEAGTLLVAAAITRGDVLVRDCLPEHLDAVIAKLRAAGAEVTAEGGRHPRARQGRAQAGRHHDPAASRASRPTCRRSSWCCMTRARGQSVLTETIFENRYMHVPELQRMGADIVVDGRTAIVRGADAS